MSAPAIVKVIECLRNSGEKKTSEEVASIIGEPPEHVNRALEKLVALDIVSQEGRAYVYQATPKNEVLSGRLLGLYGQLDRGKARELLVRGLLCQIPSKYPFHLQTLLEISGQEGLERQDVLRFLEEEMARGYITGMGVVYTRVKGSVLVPAYVHPLHFDSLHNQGVVAIDNCDSFEHQADVSGLREYYVVADYPLELSGPAMDHLKKVRRDLREYLEGMNMVKSGGWFWRLSRKETDASRPNGGR